MDLHIHNIESVVFVGILVISQLIIGNCEEDYAEEHHQQESYDGYEKDLQEGTVVEEQGLEFTDELIPSQ